MILSTLLSRQKTAITKSRLLNSTWQAPHVELLEDRILLTAEPTASIDVPSEVSLGNDFSATITFDNDVTGPPDADVGFVPFVDLILPTNGADGGPSGQIDDGVTFNGATFLGTPITSHEIVFDASGQALHPLAVDASGNPLVVTGAPGDTLVVFELPFGSFAPGQTPVQIDVDLSLSDLADIDQDLDFQVRGGFALGTTPLDDPATDPSITQSSFTTTSITPALFTLEKFNNAPESETATGPNFERTYFIEIDVADGQTLENFIVTDALPDTIVYLGATTSGTILTEPGLNNVVPAGSLLEVDLGTIVGGAGVDAVIEIQYYVNDVDSAGNPVINPLSGDDTQTINDVRGTATFRPLDPRDPVANLVSDITVQDDILENLSLATQKSFVISDDQNVSGLSPGDTLLYTIDVQISDFFSIGDLVVDDLIPDGLVFNSGFTPQLSVTEGGVSLTGGPVSFGSSNFSTTPGATPGETELQFLLSQELIDRALSGGDGILQGGSVLGGGATTVSITYEASIQTDFVTPNSTGDTAVTQGDSLTNNVVTSGSIRDNTTLVQTGTEEDDSSSTATIVTGELNAKEVAYINGVAVPNGQQNIQVGDTVTFRLSYDLPQSSIEDLVINDFLPLPVFDVAEVNPALLDFTPNPTDTPPPAGGISIGGGDTFVQLMDSAGNSVGTPTLSIDNASNSFSLDYGDFQSDTPQASRIEFLVTVTVNDVDFADGLLLTNQASASEANSGETTAPTNAIVNFVFTRPELEITKGIIATDRADVSFSGSVGPTGFTAPGASGARFGSTITSADIDADPIDANLAGIDAGDIVSFAITVENTGSGVNGAFDVTIQDILPPGFTAAPSGLNLQVTDGDGNALSFTDANGANPGLFGDGIVLDDTASTGSLAGADAPSAAQGANIAIITYDLIATQDVGPEQSLDNTATITNYAAQNNGSDFADPDLSDIATISTLAPDVEKVVYDTSISETGNTVSSNARQDITLGEIITYRITYTLTEGTYQDLLLTDQAQNNAEGSIEILSGRIISVGSNITAASGGATPAVGQAADEIDDRDGDGVNDIARFTLGDIVNTGSDNIADGADEIVIEVVGRVNSTPTTQGGDTPNDTGDTLLNQGRIFYRDPIDDVTRSETDSVTIDVVEPDLVVTKLASVSSVDGGDAITYTIELDHSDDSTSAAFDIDLTDLLSDAGLNLVSGTVTVTGNGASDATIVTGNGAGDTIVDIDISSLLTTEMLTVTFDATVSSTAPIGGQLDNTVDIGYSSAPGATDEERFYTGSASTSVDVDGASISKTVISTNQTPTDDGQINPANPDLVIGEEVTYEIVVTLPEGQAPVTITDQLPLTPGLLGFVSAEIVAIGSNISGSGLSTGPVPPASVTDSNSDGIDDQVSLDFGVLDVAVNNSPQGVNDQIVIRVTGIVEDVVANTSGDTVSNVATVDFGNGEESANADIDIVEPDLNITKNRDIANPDAGDVVTFTVTLDHTAASTANAQDVLISDAIPAGVTLVPNSVSLVGPGTIISGNTPGDTSVSVDVGELDLAQDITLTYQVTIDDLVLFNTTITNTANLSFDSIEGPGGRSDTDSDNASVTTPGDVTFEKTLVDTSLTESSGNDVLIGEVLTYELRAVIDEGTTTLRITDQLPVVATGTVLQITSGSIVSVGSSITTQFSGAPVISDTDSVNGNDRIVFNFGTITNAGDNVVNAGDEVVVRVQAVVLDIAENSNGETSTNSASLEFSEGTLTDDVTVTIVEPELEIVKDSDITNPDAGDIVTYTVTVDHTTASTVAAQDVVITDAIPAGVTLVEGSVTIISGSGSVTQGNGAGETSVEITVGELALSEAITFTYEVSVDDLVAFGTDIINTANVNYDNVAGAGGRAESDSDDALITTTGDVTFEKDIFDTSSDGTAGSDVAIGEIVTYRLRATIDEGTTTLSIVDQLPVAGGAVLQVVNASVISVGSSISTQFSGAPVLSDTDGANGNDRVEFDFGTITNAGDNVFDSGDEIIVEVQALVIDIPVNASGEESTNNATLTFSEGSLSDSETVEIVEPDLVITKDRDIADPDAGDVVTFTVVLDHTAVSTGNAQDVVISDAIPAGVTLVPGSVLVTGPGVVTQGNIPGDSSVEVTIGELALSDDVVLTYQLVVDDATLFNTTITNTADVEFDSIPGDSPNERAGDDSDTATIVTAGDVTFEKSIFATSEDGTPGSAVAVGEIITYRLRAVVDEGTTTLNVVDQLPVTADDTVLQITNASVISVGASISTQFDGTPVITDSDGTDGNDRVEFNFGVITNAGDNVIDGGDEIILEVQAIVLDVPENVDGVISTNSATLTFSEGVLTDEVDVNIIEPELEIVKDRDIANPDAGDVVTYTVTVDHTTLSTANAQDVVVTDPIPAGVTLVPGSVVITSGSGSVTSGNGPSDGNVELSIGELGLTESVTFTYQVTVDNATRFNTTIDNIATVTFDGVEGAQGRSESDSDGASITTTGDVTFDKTIFDTSVAETTGSDVVVGEIITYHLTATVDEGSTAFSITDNVPVAASGGVLQILGGNVVSLGGGNITSSLVPTPVLVDNDGIDGADEITFNFGVITNPGDNVFNAGDEIIVAVQAIVLDVVENQSGDVLTNAAVLTTDSGVLMDSEFVEVVQAELDIQKDVFPFGAEPGDTVQYTITVEHTPASNAEAFNLSLEDLVSEPLLNIVPGTVVAVNSGTDTPTILSGNGATDTDLQVALESLELGETLTVTFDVEIDAAAPFSELLTNVADLDYETSPDGGRDLEDSDDTVVATLPLVLKTTTATDLGATGDSEFDSANDDVAVGETVTFEIELTFPEATVQNVILRDVLPTFSGQDVFDIVNVSTTIGSQLTTELPGTIVLSDTNGDGGDDRVDIDFGDIDNPRNDIINDDDRIVLTIEAQLLDVPGITASDIFTNQTVSTFDFGGPTETIEDFASIDVVEPVLDITKDISDTTADAGDTLTFTVEVFHDLSTTSDAFDILVTDLLPPDVTLVAGSVALSGAGAPNAVVSTGNTSGDTNVIVDATTLSRGERLIITYDAIVNAGVAAGQTITNTADLEYDSFPGAPGRTDSDTDDVVATVSDIEFSKEVLTTSLAETGDRAFDPSNPDLAIGETVTYRLSAVLPEGTSPIIVTDNLPFVPGILEFQNAVITLGGNLSSTSPGVGVGMDTNGDMIIDQIVFNFGDITNLADGVVDANDELTIDVTALVVDEPENTAGLTLTNTAELDFGLGSITDTADIDIVEPSLTFDKTANRTQGDAGDSITFSLEIQHDSDSGASAYDLAITDILGPGFTLVPGSVVFAGSGAGNANVISDIGTLEVDISQLDLGQTLTISYRATVDDTVRVTDALNNNASLGYDSAAGPGGRSETLSDFETFDIVGVPTFDKVIASTSQSETGDGEFDPDNPDVTVGEQITYDLIVTLPEGTGSVVITDQLPFGSGVIEFDGATIALGGNITTGLPGTVVTSDSDGDGIDDLLTFDFGDVVNTGDNVVNADDQIVITVTGTVLDVPVNAAGVVLTNQSTLNYEDGLSVVTDTASADIVEPVLTFDKGIDVTEGDAGDLITYTLDITHDGSSTGPAYDLVVNDTLGTGLNLVAGSVVISGSGAGNAVLVNDNGNLQIDISVLEQGQTISVTYEAIADDSVRVTDELINSATLDYDTAAGPGGRAFDLGDEEIFTVVGEPTLEKTIISTSLSDTGDAAFDPNNPDVNIDEQITYEIVATLPEGTSSIVITDQLPFGAGVISFDTATINLGGNITSTLPGTVVSSDSDGDGIDDLLVFDFGDVVNIGDNVIDDNDQIVITVVGTVEDVNSNAAGIVLTNESTLDFEDGLFSVSDTASVDVLGPVLTFDKGIDVTQGDAGDVITYSLSVAHDPASTGPAYDIVIADLLGAGLNLVAGSVTINGTGAPASVLVNDNGNLQIDASLLNLDETLTITYQAIADDSVRVTDQLINSATLDYDSAEGPGGRPASLSDEEIFTVVGVPTLEKTIISTSLPETGDGEFDPNNPDVTIGEQITYQIVTSLPEGTGSVVITDQLPFGSGVIEFDGATIALGGNITTGLPGTVVTSDSDGDGIDDLLTFDFGDVVNTGDNVVNADDQIVITVTGTVLDVPVNAAGVVLTNQSTLNYEDGLSVVTDTASADIVEPVLTFDKGIDVTEGDAGDLITYTLDITHDGSSTGPAYDLVVNDTLGTGLNLVAGSVVISGSGAGNAVLVNDNGNLQIDISVLEQGQTISVTYEAIADDSVRVTDELINAATLDYDTAAGPGGRTFDLGDEEIFTVVGEPTLEKTIISTSLSETSDGEFDPNNPDVTVGEQITYQIVTSLPEGTGSVVITDQMPFASGVIAFDSATITLGGNITTGLPGTVVASDSDSDGIDDLLTFNFGDVVNEGDNVVNADDLIVITVTGTIVDVPVNISGLELTNAATLDYENGLSVVTDSVSADIVEPALSFDKDVDITSGDAGDIATYSLQISHTSDSTAPAYDLSIVDQLGEGLTLLAGSVHITGTGSSNAVLISENGTLEIDISVLLPGETLNVTYQASIDDSVTVGDELVNEATLGFDSAQGPGGRTDSLEDRETIIVDGSPAFSKSILSTSLVETDNGEFNATIPDVTVGEQISYQLLITLLEGTTNVSVTDQLPIGNGVIALDGASVAFGNNITSTLPGTLLLIDSDGDGIDDQLTIDFGAVTNIGDNIADSNDQIVVTVTGTVADVTQNAAGITLTNQATADFGFISLSDNASVEIVEPILEVIKTIDDDELAPTEIGTYTVIVRHTDGSTATAADVVLSDLLNPQTTLVPGSVFVTGPDGAVVELGNGGFDNSIRVSIGALERGDELIITYQASVNTSGINPLEPVVNTAIVDFDTARGPGGREFTIEDEAAFDLAASRFNRAQLIASEAISSNRFFVGIDDADDYIENEIQIDPVYTGAATPNANVNLTLVDRTGAIVAVRSVTADVGGNWSVNLPLTEFNSAQNDIITNRFFERAELFESSTGLFNRSGSLLGSAPGIRDVGIGADTSGEVLSVQVSADRPSFENEPSDNANLRTYFTPAARGSEINGVNPNADIESIFGGRAEKLVDDLANATRNPLEFGVNKFNEEFLANSGLPNND